MAGTPIAGATASTYAPVSADIGSTLTVDVIASNSFGSSAVATSAATAAVSPAGAAPVNTAAPTINGIAQVNQTLTSLNGTWQNNPVSFAYQWNRSGTPIVGATSSSYVPVPADVGATLTLSVIATNGFGDSSPATSAPTSVVTAASSVPVNSAVPTIAGTAQVGLVLTVSSTGTWSNSPTNFTYQWNRAGMSITGATASTYACVAADVGFVLTLSVVASNVGGSSAPAVSLGTSAVIATVFFSSTGVDTNPGTAASPVKTPIAAIKLAQGKVTAGYKSIALQYVNTFTPPASGITTTYYVSTASNSPAGSDAAAGTIAAPFLTLGHALSVLSAAGTAIIMRGGTYVEPSALTKTLDGTVTNPIALYSYPGELAVIDGGSVGTADLLTITGAYWIVGGIEFTNVSTGNALVMHNKSNCKVLNNYVHNVGNKGIVLLVDVTPTTANVVSGNVIFNTCKSNNVVNHMSWGSGINVVLSNSLTISGNIITQNWGEGIKLMSCTTPMISDNLVGDDFAWEVFNDNVGTSTIQRHFLFSNNIPSFRRNSGVTSIGILLDQEVEAPTVIALNNESILDNIMDGLQTGLLFLESIAGGLKNSTISRNTIMNGLTDLISIAADAGTTGNVLSGNTLYKTSGVMQSGTSAGITSSNNNWYTGSAGPFAGSGDVSVNPLGAPLPAPPMSLVVSGPGSGIGVINLPSTALLLSTTIAPPPAGEVAKMADAFVDSIGVQLHMGDSGGSPYVTKFSSVVNAIKVSGIRNIRDGFSFGGSGSTDALSLISQVKAANGTDLKFMLTQSVPGCQITAGQINPQIYLNNLGWNINNIFAFENVNEWDGFCGSASPSWQSNVSFAQTTLWNDVRGTANIANMPVVGPSLIGNVGQTQLTANANSVGNISAFMTYGNAHDYTVENRPSDDFPWIFSSQTGMNGTRPMIVSETGYTNAQANVTVPRTSKYFTRLHFEWFNMGAVKTYVYELFDEPQKAGSEGQFGLLFGDGSFKPGMTAITNIITILKDPGGSFIPSALDYTLTGDSSGFLHHTLLQKRNGRFYLALWLEYNWWNYPGPSNVTVTFNSGTKSSVNKCDVLTTSTMTNIGTNVASVTLPIIDQTTILEIIP